MTKGLKLMSQIATLARKAERELLSAEDKQTAVEIKLAAEVVLEAHRPRATAAHHAHHD